MIKKLWLCCVFVLSNLLSISVCFEFMNQKSTVVCGLGIFLLICLMSLDIVVIKYIKNKKEKN